MSATDVASDAEMNRYRLIDENGTDLGLVYSARFSFTPGDMIDQGPGGQYEVVRAVVPEDGPGLRVDLVVRLRNTHGGNS